MKKKLVVVLLASMAVTMTACSSITDKIDEIKGVVEEKIDRDQDDEKDDDDDDDKEDVKESEEAESSEASEAESEEATEASDTAVTEVTEQSSFIEDYGIHGYTILTDDLSWEEAWEQARKMGGYLAHINSREEREHIENLLSETKNPALCYYIGGKRDRNDSGYYWVAPDGTPTGEELTVDPVCYDYWLEGEPSYMDEETGLEEGYMDLLYIKKKNKWYLNDAPEDMIAASSSWSGKIGYIVEYDDNIIDSGSSSSGSTSSTSAVADTMDFTFASGAGGWSTEMTLYSDGTFKGSHHDSDMGDTGYGYPNGTFYFCDFEGKFKNMRKIDDLTWSMTLDYCDVDYNGIKDGEIIDGMKYYRSTAYGIDGGHEFLIYLPGTRLSKLTEDAQSWLYGYGLNDELYSDKYLIYNVDEGLLWAEDKW